MMKADRVMRAYRGGALYCCFLALSLLLSSCTSGSGNRERGSAAKDTTLVIAMLGDADFLNFLFTADF